MSMKLKILLIAFLIMAALVNSAERSPARLALAQEHPASGKPSSLLKGWSELNPIDIHAHVFKKDPAVGELLKRLNLKLLNVCVIDDRDPFFNATRWIPGFEGASVK